MRRAELAGGALRCARAEVTRWLRREGGCGGEGGEPGTVTVMQRFGDPREQRFGEPGQVLPGDPTRRLGGQAVDDLVAGEHETGDILPPPLALHRPIERRLQERWLDEARKQAFGGPHPERGRPGRSTRSPTALGWDERAIADLLGDTPVT